MKTIKRIGRTFEVIEEQKFMYHSCITAISREFGYVTLLQYKISGYQGLVVSEVTVDESTLQLIKPSAYAKVTTILPDNIRQVVESA